MIYRILIKISFLKSDLTGARTQDPLLKREMLYQLSYQVIKKLNRICVKRLQIYNPIFINQAQLMINLEFY